MIRRTVIQLVSATTVAFFAACTAAQATNVTVPSGSMIQNYINSNPATGTTFTLSGTYPAQTISPNTNDVFIGSGDIHSATPTIIDGGKTTAFFVNCYNGTAGVQLKNMVIRNFTPYNPNASDPYNAYEVWTGPNWLLSDVDVDCSGVDGVNLYNGSMMVGGEVESCGHRGMALASNDVVNNVEIAYNNTMMTSQTGATGDAAGLKAGASDHVTVANCNVHDNHCVGIWADDGCTNWFIQNNFVANNDYTGIQYEVSSSGSIYENLVSFNGGTNAESAGQLGDRGQIGIVDSDSTGVYRNVVSAAATQNAIFMTSNPTRSNPHVLQGNGLNNNYVTFTGLGGFYGLAIYYGGNLGQDGNYSDYNNFILNPGTNWTVFVWKDYENPTNFSTYQSTKGEDPSSHTLMY